MTFEDLKSNLLGVSAKHQHRRRILPGTVHSDNSWEKCDPVGSLKR